MRGPGRAGYRHGSLARLSTAVLLTKAVTAVAVSGRTALTARALPGREFTLATRLVTFMVSFAVLASVPQRLRRRIPTTAGSV